MKQFLKMIILFLVIFSSCKRGVTGLHSFNEDAWNFKDSVSFSFNINDTVKLYDLSLFFRNTLDYEYRNLFLFVDTRHNGVSIKKDTLEYLITNKYGQWMGAGLGKIKDNYFIFEENLAFKSRGSYELIVSHGMRSNPLVGANKLGFKIK